MKFWMWLRIIPDLLMIIGGLIVFADLMLKMFFSKTNKSIVGRLKTIFPQFFKFLYPKIFLYLYKYKKIRYVWIYKHCRTKSRRAGKLWWLLQGENGLKLIEKHSLKQASLFPRHIVSAFDILMNQQIAIEDLKNVSNKLSIYSTKLFSNILHWLVGLYILDIYTQDNAVALANLKDTREILRQ